MPNSKLDQQSPAPEARTDDVSSTDMKNVQEMLLIIQKKILGSPALNGGFDTLIQKVESIEKHQDKMSERVDEIHEAVYNPDTGLFARIKDTNLELAKIKLHQEHTDTVIEEGDQTVDKTTDTISSIDNRLKEMERSYAILKWFAITIGSGVILATVKAIYNFIASHVKIF